MVGQEIEWILDHHDQVTIRYRQNSKRQEGELSECALAFLATKDPESMAFAPDLIKQGIRVVDMSGAFRLTKDLFESGYGMAHTAPELLKEAVYGMPAIHADQIFSIGTVSRAPVPVVHDAALNNVPETGIYAWDPGGQLGVHRMDEFFFTDGRSE